MLSLSKIKPGKMKKRGQVEFGPAILIAVILGLIILAPIMIRIIGTVTGTFFTNMNESFPDAVAPANQAVNSVYNFFDYLVVIAMFINIIMLFISSWFIDTNPVFILLYIVFAFIFVLILPSVLDAVDTVWAKMESVDSLDTWEDSSLGLNFTDFIRRNLMVFTISVFAITGIITYAKFKLGSGQY